MIRLPYLDPSRPTWFPPPDSALATPDGLLAAGGDLSTERLLAAYAQAIFPWYSDGEPILWWSPSRRAVFDTASPHVPRRLARWLHACEWAITADHAFDEVIDACAAPRASAHGTWITGAMREAYLRLHALGHAHSVEVRDGERVVGGIYGVSIGRMFFGESMFSLSTNGSKVALLALCRALAAWDCPLLDAQVESEHLATLGAHSLSRTTFRARVDELVRRPALDGSWRTRFPSISPVELAG